MVDCAPRPCAVLEACNQTPRKSAHAARQKEQLGLFSHFLLTSKVSLVLFGSSFRRSCLL